MSAKIRNGPGVAPAGPLQLVLLEVPAVAARVIAKEDTHLSVFYTGKLLGTVTSPELKILKFTILHARKLN